MVRYYKKETGLGFNPDVYKFRPSMLPVLREWSRKKAIDFAVKRFYEGTENIRNRRYFYNDGKKLFSEKEYRTMLALHKSELQKTLSNLLRDGDKIAVPPQL